MPSSNILKQQLYRESIAFSYAAKIAETAVVGKICRREMTRRLLTGHLGDRTVVLALDLVMALAGAGKVTKR